MARRERPLDPLAGPLQGFAHGLRELRYRAGEPSYRELARKAFVSAGALSEAAGGAKLPSLSTTLAYVRACGGDEQEWEERWVRVKAQLARASQVEQLTADDPATVGPFRLQGRLGAGAMGQVYLGRTPGGRLIAVKVVRQELAKDPVFRSRFRREVEAARRVHGLYVAPLVDADPDGTPPWLATAYIPGPTLREVVAEHGQLPLESLLPLASGMAEALEAIFAARVVHRDLKPANVLLADDGPRVIDFGIAHTVDGTQLTHAGTSLGTPGFIAPEQVRGLPTGQAADVFALGGVLAFAATGQPPFGEGTAESVLYRVVHESPDLAGVPEELRDLVEACLAKNPERRPTPAEIIRRCQTGREGTGWLPQAFTQVPEPVETPPRGRGPAVVAAIIAGIALVAAYLVGSAPPNGSLRLHRATMPAQVDLTSAGVTDWAHWGHLSSDDGRREEFTGNPDEQECRYSVHCMNRRAGGNQIGNFTAIGNVQPFRLRYRDATTTFSWRDGDPVRTASEVKSLQYMGLKGNGFRITVNADRKPRVLTLYLGAYQGKVKCAGRLSDDSAAPVEDDTLDTFGTVNVGKNSTCTFHYQAGRDGQQLIAEITLTVDIGGGNVSLYAATLQ